MVRFLRYLAYMLFFLFALLFFLPKENLFFFALKELEKREIKLSNQTLLEHSFGVELKGVEIFYKDIEVVRVDLVDVACMLFYNRVSLNNIVLTSLVTAYIPKEIKKITLVYTFTDPLHVQFSSTGLFGNLKGEYDIFQKKITLEVRPSKLFFKKYKTSLRYLKKADKGVYRYEKSL